MEENTQDIQKKLKEFSIFLMDLEKVISDNFIIEYEKVLVVLMQNPWYSKYDGKLYSRGLVKIGNRYYPLFVRATNETIFVQCNLFEFNLTWEEAEMYIQKQNAD